jgi:nitroimidazol reductase NimA-like FMN-containing flavoprotein (pyridoxamine 5'-phosphate oxidase superfamily)
VYERERIEAIVDEAVYCHLAWVGADGDPRVIPTIHARVDDTLYVHGSSASTMLRTVKAGLPVAIAITIVDGIRFARSMFEHSMNYRTVLVYGTATEVTDAAELDRVFDVITDHVAPGRSADARRPNDEELGQTTFIKVALDEASAKVSEGFPEEPPEDLALPVWAGILPLRLSPGTPESDPLNAEGVQVPRYVSDWRRPGERG